MWKKNCTLARVNYKLFAWLLLRLTVFVPLASTVSHSVTGPYTDYREQEQTWIIGNRLVEASFQIQQDGRFRSRWLTNATSGYQWVVPDATPSSPANLTVDGIALDSDTAYSVISYQFSDINTPAKGKRFSIVLATTAVSGRIQFEAEVYKGQPFIRYRTIYTNTGSAPSVVTQADMLPWTFESDGSGLRDFFVGQWKPGRVANFEPHETNLSVETGPVEMFTGAAADHTAWRAIRTGTDDGLITAWEFDGRARAHAQYDGSSASLQLDAQLMDLNHPMAAGGTFTVPYAFIGVFHGDWDEAGYRTQRFAESVLALPMPEADKFPYVMFDTWGYDKAIDETTSMAAAARAADIGAEVFILDFGWARNIGDWNADPAKFPNGLKPLSDYVHSRGMKFGLHLPFLEAAPDSPVLKRHPDWEAIDPHRKSYFGATSLCPSHLPTRRWIISELIRVIQQNGVDWVTQDGENMVKICNSTTHTHAAGDSNYSNSVDGLDEVIKAVQKALPNVVWENCEDGGSLQTFHMIQRYVTSVVNDCDDALTTRRGVYGGSFPFPPRYTERYMLDDPSNSYETRSAMFGGGPFILMSRITNWSASTLRFVQSEIGIYKSLRSMTRDSEIFHLTRQPDGTFNDAIEAHNREHDMASIFVYGVESRSTVTFVPVRGLDNNALYRVDFLQIPHSYYTTGTDLMQNGLAVPVQRKTAEIVSITRQ